MLGAVCLAASTAYAQPSVIQGYAFDRPELLADQRVWGIVHAVRLLAKACAQAGHGAAAEAWVDWVEREAAQVEAISSVLARHYFGADEAPPDALALALGLELALALPAAQLEPACASLPEALVPPRYDLRLRREALREKYREGIGRHEKHRQ